MRRGMAVLAALFSCVYAAGGRPFLGIVAAADDPNAYFGTLASSPAAWRSNSLRSQSLIDSVSAGKPNTWITYDSGWDAAKAVIPPFVDVGLRIASVGSDRITFTAPLLKYQKDAMIQYRGLLVDNEVMTVIRWYTNGEQFADGDTSVLINRAQFNTALASHAPGATAFLSQNNLMNYLNVPLGTVDGNTYLFTWDVRYDSSYLGNDLNPLAVGHKEFQFTAGTRPGIWLETQIGPDGVDGLGRASVDRSQSVAVVRGRYYDASVVGAAGSNITYADPVKPQAARFVIRANVWTRFWWLIDQRANDYDRATLWVADETTAPVKVFDGLTTRAYGDTIGGWWYEQNTSYDLYRGARRDLVSWVRNFVALQNPSDVTSLLIRPLAGVPPPPSTTTPTAPTTSSSAPAPPTNLRIISN